MSRPLAGNTADERWNEFLDSIERGISEAMLLVDGRILGHPNSWSAPSDLPPLTKSAASRVSHLLETQRALLDQLRINRDQALKLRRFAQVDAAKGIHRGPHFIDTEA